MDILIIVGISLLVLLFILAALAVFNIARYLKKLISLAEQYILLSTGWNNDIIEGLYTTNEEKKKTSNTYASLEKQMHNMVESDYGFPNSLSDGYDTATSGIDE